MSANNHCRWCGRKYDSRNSTASDPGYFCSKRCEVAAHRAGAAPSGKSIESRVDSCMGRGIIYFLVFVLIYVIIDTCTDSDKEEPNKKASQRTEKVAKTGKRENVVSMTENVSSEETPRVVSEELPIDSSSTHEEQATARQTSEEQTSEEQVSGDLTKAEEAAVAPSNTTAEQTVYDLVEQMPEFPGGNAKLEKYFESHLRYPKVAQENGTRGRVIVQFVVNTDGSISDAQVIRSLDTYCDEEALRLINNMPRWTPGQTGGKNVRVKYVVPITFKLP